MRVTKQVLVPFSIDKYKDEVLCDVVPMQASTYYLDDLGNLIGAPSMMCTRTDTLNKDGKSIILAPLPLGQVYEKKLQIKKSIAASTKQLESMTELEEENVRKENGQLPSGGKEKHENSDMVRKEENSFYAKERKIESICNLNK